MHTTVVIPTYNRPNSLAICLSALAKQENTAFKWEVLVINDGGEPIDITAFKEMLNLRCVYQENAGPGSARNKGVKMARGQNILFTDDDCEPDPLWVSNMTSALVSGKVIAGHTVNKLTEYTGSEASQLLLEYLMVALKNTPEYFFTSNNLGLVKSDFLDLGGFDKDFYTSAGEDREFTVRANFKGYELARVESAVIHHSHPLNLWQFWRMHFKYGRATHIYHAIKAKRSIHFPPVLVPGFYYKLLLYPFSRKEYTWFKRFQLFIFMILSQMATVAGYLRNKLNPANSKV